MSDDYDDLLGRAIEYCHSSQYEKALVALDELLCMYRRQGAPCSSSSAMYWYLVAKHQGDEGRAMEAFVELDDD